MEYEADRTEPKPKPNLRFYVRFPSLQENRRRWVHSFKRTAEMPDML